MAWFRKKEREQVGESESAQPIKNVHITNLAVGRRHRSKDTDGKVQDVMEWLRTCDWDQLTPIEAQFQERGCPFYRTWHASIDTPWEERPDGMQYEQSFVVYELVVYATERSVAEELREEFHDQIAAALTDVAEGADPLDWRVVPDFSADS